MSLVRSLQLIWRLGTLVLSQYEDCFPGMGIFIIKIRRSWDCLIFMMGIPKVVKQHLYIEMAPRLQRSPSSDRNLHALWSLFNSLVPGRFKVNFRWIIFKLILGVNGWGISCETALIWVSLDHTYDKSTLVQGMAWCRQATSHYLIQWWGIYVYVIWPQWVNNEIYLLLVTC